MPIVRKRLITIILSFLLISLLAGCKKKTLLNEFNFPVFNSAEMAKVTNRSATIGWASNKNVLVSIDYGTTSAYGLKQESTEYGQTGQITITNLAGVTQYYCQLTAIDNDGNVVKSGVYNFTTSGPLHHITIDPAPFNMYMEETKSITANGRDSNEGLVEIDPTWDLTGTLVTLDKTTGPVLSLTSGLAKGTVQLTATYSTLTATATVSIIAGPYEEPPENGVIFRTTGANSIEMIAGYDIGLNTSILRTDWLNDNRADWTATHDYMKMAYPGDAVFGAVFVVVAPMRSLDLMPERKAFDYRLFTKLQVELKGEVGGEKVKVGIKDINDLDDGAEVKYLISNITTDWKTYEIPLSTFPSGTTSQLKQIYVAIEFVWDNDSVNGLNAATPNTIYFRNVQYAQ